MSAELLKSLQEMDPQVEDSVSAEACCKLADAAFKEMQMELAFSICRAGVHKHLNASDKLCKRYLFMLDMIVKKSTATAKKVEGPPRMLYLREMYDKMDATLKEHIAKMVRRRRRRRPRRAPAPPLGRALPPPPAAAAGGGAAPRKSPCSPGAPRRAGPRRRPRATAADARPLLLAPQGGDDSVKPGEKFVLMKERSVMVVGFSHAEWRLLLEKQSPGSDKMQMISGLEEAVMRGLSQSEGTPDSQTELKAAWNSWARKLCEVEGGASRCAPSVCSSRRFSSTAAVYEGARLVERGLGVAAGEQAAKALLATSRQKAGKKKAAGVAVTGLCAASRRLRTRRCRRTRSSATRWSSPSRCSSRCTAQGRAQAALVPPRPRPRTPPAGDSRPALPARPPARPPAAARLTPPPFLPSPQHLFFGLARLYAKHGLNKDSLVAKLPSLCNSPPDRRTWDLLKSMAECTPMAVEQQLQKYISETGPGAFSHVPHITEVMCKLPFGAHGSAAARRSSSSGGAPRR